MDEQEVKKSNCITPENLVPENTYIDYAALREQYGLKDKQILAAFIKGSRKVSETKLAELVGVSRQTLYNWKQVPGYIALTNNIALLALKGMFSDAVFNLQDLMNDEDSRVKLNATKYTIDTIVDIEKGLTEPTQQKDSIDDILEILTRDPEEMQKIVAPGAEELGKNERIEDIIDPSEL